MKIQISVLHVTDQLGHCSFKVRESDVRIEPSNQHAVGTRATGTSNAIELDAGAL